MAEPRAPDSPPPQGDPHTPILHFTKASRIRNISNLRRKWKCPMPSAGVQHWWAFSLLVRYQCSRYSHFLQTCGIQQNSPFSLDSVQMPFYSRAHQPAFLINSEHFNRSQSRSYLNQLPGCFPFLSIVSSAEVNPTVISCFSKIPRSCLVKGCVPFSFC